MSNTTINSINKKKVRVRIAPSPTGYPHIGTIYQALFNFAYAKKYGGEFIIRIEDTDRSRFVEGAEEKIYEAIDWFGLTEHESPRKGGPFAPYRQSERLAIYKKYAQELVQKGHVYYCFCTKERLDEIRKQQQLQKKIVMYDKHCRNFSQEDVQLKLDQKIPSVIRMKVPQNEKIICKDELRGEIVVDSNTVDDQVILKSDGFPTYHLAFIIDDHEMQITHVVRAEEWLPSLPKHVLLYSYLGWEAPPFYHTPALRNPDKSKLSKRHGHTNVEYYKEEGFLPVAILNFLALMGWSHKEEKEIFSLSEFIELFDLKDIKPVCPIFDLTKLKWMNQQYIQHLAPEDLRQKLIDFYPSLHKVESHVLDKLIPLIQTRMETFKDFELLTKHFFQEPAVLSQDPKLVEALKGELQQVDNWNAQDIFAALKKIMQQFAIRMPTLYTILTGSDRGLPLPESLEILGKERVLSRLQAISKQC